MKAGEQRSRRATHLPDLDTLDVQSLKALVLAKQTEMDWRATEIESLKLLIAKLKRMHFGRVRRSVIATSNSSNCGWKIWKPTRRPPSRSPHASQCGLEADRPAETSASALAVGTARETETIAPVQEACPD